MKKPRTKKKHNPNKLLPHQVQELQQAAAARRAEAEFMARCELECQDTYEMEMTFFSCNVHKYIEEQKVKQAELINMIEDPTVIPYHIIIGAYDYQDLAIALTLESIHTPEVWNIAAEGYFIDVENPDAEMVSHDYHITLPSMTQMEVWKGKDKCAVPLGDGLKVIRKWEGLQQELIKHFAEKIEQDGLLDTYSLETIQVHFAVDAKFKNANHYAEFLTISEWVEKGIAEERLYKLWVAEQLKIKELQAKKNKECAA